ncbi:MAG: TlpA disulfide reductase family protein [Pseudomonadota bacterium]
MSSLIFCWLTLEVRAEVRFDAALRDAVTNLRPLINEAPTNASLAEKIVVVTFFASWCPPCLAEFKHLNTLVERYPDAIEVVAINVYEDDWDGAAPDSMTKFLRHTQPRFWVVKGNEAIRDRFGGIDRIPNVFVFTPTGESVMHFIHHQGAKKTHAALDELEAAVRRAGVE